MDGSARYASREASRSSDESFVKSWGSLPEDPLTLCGTRRFVRECRASLPTGRRRAAFGQADGAASVRAWAVVMTVEAELSEPRVDSGESKQGPSGSSVIQVSAPGLANWSTTANGSFG